MNLQDQFSEDELQILDRVLDRLGNNGITYLSVDTHLGVKLAGHTDNLKTVAVRAENFAEACTAYNDKLCKMQPAKAA